ncbi:Mo-dependent nitrogenase C-terminal domain-containing protein [Microcoleus sp. MON1_C1]|uniref:Mo-dependent nitrogenase C-terminal domain-containing protein n=1 Tax=Microcoleus sp. MON1_C1 TaxID=2818827 RepID=UPI002FD3EFBD
MNLTTSIFLKNQYQDLTFRDRPPRATRGRAINNSVVCQLILARCSCERDIPLWGHHLFYIPSMCKLNPVYEELMGLRFRSLSFLGGVSQNRDKFPTTVVSNPKF